MNSKNLLKIIKTSRPMLWIVHITAFIYGAAATGNFSLNDYKFLLSTVVLSLPYSIYIYALNDYHDLKTDQINPRKGGVFGEKHSDKESKKLRIWSLVGFTISFAIFSFFGANTIIVFIGTSLLLYFYSSPPFRLKSIPLVDFISGGSLYLMGIIYLGHTVFGGDLFSFFLKMPRSVLMWILIGGLLHITGAVLDFIPDKKNGIKSSPIFFGVKTMLTVNLIILAYLAYLIRNVNAFLPFILLGIVIAFALYKERLRKGESFQKIFAVYLPIFLFIYTLLLALIDVKLLIF